MSGRFTRVTFLIMGPLLTWLACFTAVYVFGAIACARGLTQAHVAGIGLVGVVTTVLVLATAAFTAWQLVSALRQYRNSVHSERLVTFLVLSLGGLALLGLILLALPALVIRPACAGQPQLGVAAESSSTLPGARHAG